jgi:hypothetical protein
MGPMSRKRLACQAPILTLAAFAVTLGTAPAAPPRISAVSPANGERLPPSAGVLFQVRIRAPQFPYVSAVVASRDSLDPGGELASNFMLERVVLLPESTADPETYQGTSAVSPASEGWSSTPGTYYWQVSVPYTEVSGGEPPANEGQSPVFTLVIARVPSTLPSGESTLPTIVRPGLAAASSLTLAASYKRVKFVIRKRTGRRAHHLRVRCARRTDSQVVCKAAWFSAWPASPNTVRYVGRFFLEARSDGIHSSFTGSHRRLGCIRFRRAKRCASRVHWR